MNKNRKYMLRGFLVLSLFVTILCTSCARTPKTADADAKIEEAIAAYLAPLQAEADAYFTDIVETAVGSKPEEIRIGFHNVDAESLKETKELSELLDGTGPVLLAGFISASEKGYSDDEIHAIILETKKREITVDLYFNYNDDYVYQVREDGVVIDKATGKDGGAMREQIIYELTESEE